MTTGPAQAKSSTRDARASAARADADADVRHAPRTVTRYSRARFGRSFGLGVMTARARRAGGHAGSSSALGVMTATSARGDADESGGPLCEAERGVHRHQPSLAICARERTDVEGRERRPLFGAGRTADGDEGDERRTRTRNERRPTARARSSLLASAGREDTCPRGSRSRAGLPVVGRARHPLRVPW
jgi:hypothetical protein